MKKYSVAILSAIIGSVITIGLFLAIDFDGNERVTIEHVPDTTARGVLYTMDQDGNAVPLDFTEIAKESMDAVVHIGSVVEVQQQGGRDYQQLPDPFREFFRRYQEQQPQQRQQPDQRRRQGSGSGVIINEDGYIVTNNHVVAEAVEINVTLNDNREYQARIIGTDPTTDLALIKINEDNLPTLPMVNSDNIEVGEWVLAMGNPYSLNSTVTAGIVSAKSRSVNILREQYAIESFIQTDAAINPGNSGGALVNMQGGLVGINTAIFSPTGSYSGYGFAVPSNIVNKVVSDLLEYGTVQRGYLGVTIRDVTGSLADEEDLDMTEGVYIDSVLNESAADKAGIESGDVITEINGNKITQSSELQEMVARQRPGDEVEITIYRDGRRMERTAELQSISGTTEVTAEKRGEMQSILGAELAAISDEEARDLGIDGGVRITRLYAGKLRSETNIQEGFIITRVNQKSVKTVEGLTNILQNTSGGVMIEGLYEGDDEIRYYAFGL